MSMSIKQLLWASLVAGIVACNLWPFTCFDVYFLFRGIERLIVATIIVHLTEWDVKINRVSRIAFLWAVFDVLKETRQITGLAVFFDPIQFKSLEYALYGITAVACLIGLRGLFILMLYLILNYHAGKGRIRPLRHTQPAAG